MKLLTALLFALLLVSCGKETECLCTESVDVPGAEPVTTQELYEGTDCNDLDETYTQNGVTTSYDCSAY